MKLHIKIKKPVVPRYLFLQGVSNDGKVFSEAGRIPLSEITEKEAMEFAKLLKEEFLAEWVNQKQRAKDAIGSPINRHLIPAPSESESRAIKHAIKPTKEEPDDTKTKN